MRFAAVRIEPAGMAEGGTNPSTTTLLTTPPGACVASITAVAGLPSVVVMRAGSANAGPLVGLLPVPSVVMVTGPVTTSVPFFAPWIATGGFELEYCPHSSTDPAMRLIRLSPPKTNCTPLFAVAFSGLTQLPGIDGVETSGTQPAGVPPTTEAVWSLIVHTRAPVGRPPPSPLWKSK